MKKRIKNIIVIVISIVLLSGCVNDKFDTPTTECIDQNLTKNKEVSDVYNFALTATSTALEYTNDDIIEAIITSSDEGGNFFKSLSLIAIDGSRGFSISIDDSNLYTKKLQPGKKVFIKMKGLYCANPSSGTKGLIIGAKPTGSQILDRIPTLEYSNFIIPSCTVVDEETIVKKLILTQLNNDAYLNSLVEIDNVQFENEGSTYGNKPSDDFDKSENITDGISSFVTRTSKFANFSGNLLPSGRGSIRGVLTKFGNTYQLIIREERDVKLNNPRVDYWPPIVGNSIQYLSAFTENFENYTTGTAITGQNNFPKYINDPVIGTKTWRCRTATGTTKYIEMSSFGNPLQSNRALFIVPINMTGTNKLSFKTRVSFFNGNPLKVYYTSNYQIGTDINTATLVDITSKFFLSDGMNSNFNNSIPSGGAAFTLPNVGNGFIIFEYIGSGVSTPVLTTNFGIDDITVN